jgi:hypothetical protein
MEAVSGVEAGGAAGRSEWTGSLTRLPLRMMSWWWCWWVRYVALRVTDPNGFRGER